MLTYTPATNDVLMGTTEAMPEVYVYQLRAATVRGPGGQCVLGHGTARRRSLKAGVAKRSAFGAGNVAYMSPSAILRCPQLS